MNKKSFFCLAFLLLIASNAVGQHVGCEFSGRVDFSKFKTYKWVTFKNEAPIDNLTDEQIKAAVDAAAAKKGLQRVDVDTADLFIGYQSNELITETFSRNPTWDESPPTVYQGELGIDMYTPANHQLVWRGVASKTLDPKASPEKRQKKSKPSCFKAHE
jgi:hypothetical protein